MPFIRAACTKTGLPTRIVNYTDSIYLSKSIWKDARKHGLDAIIERLSLNTRDFRRHDARGDVGILAEAVTRMWRKLSPDRTSFPAPLFTSVFPK
jgi:DNA polymerase III epsilon subunit-like protein